MEVVRGMVWIFSGIAHLMTTNRAQVPMSSIRLQLCSNGNL